MKNLITGIAVVFMVISALIIINSVNNLKSKITTYKEEFNRCIGEKSMSEYEIQKSTQQKNLIDDLWLSKTKNNRLEASNSDIEIDLSNLANDSKVVYWYDHKKACSACVDEAIKNLVDYSEIIGANRIALITNYDDLKQLRILKLKYGISFQCFNTPEAIHDLLLKNNYVHQLIFVLDNNSRILMPRIINPSLSISQNYLDKLTSLINVK